MLIAIAVDMILGSLIIYPYAALGGSVAYLAIVTVLTSIPFAMLRLTEYALMALLTVFLLGGIAKSAFEISVRFRI